MLKNNQVMCGLWDFFCFHPDVAVGAFLSDSAVVFR